jgi:putative transcriptional regulator
MKDELFAELMQSASEALEHAQGKRELRTTVLPDPPKPMAAAEIRDLRQRLHASQAVFAHYLNVSTKLVQAWEAQRRRPEGAALKLLRLAQKQPAVLLADAQPGFRLKVSENAPPLPKRKSQPTRSSRHSRRAAQQRRASA